LAILGKPNTLDRDDTNWTSGNFREVNMVWPAWYKGTNDHSLDGTLYTAGASLTTNNGCGLKRANVNGVLTAGQIVVEFDEVIENDANNPYGIDFIVHGNPFFATGIMVYENSNMDAYTLSAFGGGGEFGASGPGAVFAEPVTISVAASLDGPWYTFTSAPGDVACTADNFFPTQPYKWDSDNHVWLGEELDWEKPVNPWIVNYFGNQTVADAIKLYAGSAGGTPFDLDWLTDENGDPVSLEWIRYIKFSDPENHQGEICAAADVAPVKLGDEMSVTPFNLEVGVNHLNFVDPDDATTKRVQIVVTDAEQALSFRTAARSDLSAYAGAPANPLAAYDVTATVILDPQAAAVATADLSFYVGDTYSGDGSDLAVHQWIGEDWDTLTPSAYDATNKLLRVEGVTAFAVFAVAQTSVAGSLSGTVVLGDWVGPDGDGSPADQPVVIELAQNGTVVRTATPTLNANGQFTISDVFPGTYDVRVKASHWLAKVQTGIAVSGSTMISTSFSLINGDCDGDNEVTSLDLAIITLALGSESADSNWNSSADLDGDDEVTSLDMNIAVANYDETGD
jgi:hypothetical protein